MDPILPIVPRHPSIAPVADGRGPDPGNRAAREQRERRERRRRTADQDGRVQQQQHSYEPGLLPPDEEDGSPHIDVRA